ncbi:ATP-binding protein [Rhodopseudomonas telluris]|uniref:ATP-binding protein n=1 Tax=Rhodopseudomonas telluris TaxID=644215 RepID=A0ABV6EYH8_9BRAD
MSDIMSTIVETEDPIARMRRLRSQQRSTVSTTMTQLQSAYFGTERDKLLDEEISALIDSFLEFEAAEGSRRVGRLREGRALTVTGASGAGKSRALDRVFLKREEFTGYGRAESDCMLVSVTAPSPCTLRLLGESILKALGYPLTRKLDENVAWDLVHKTLELRRVRFLHIDELQHVLQSRNSVEIGKLQDTLKGLLQDKNWPVWLILSGLPSVAAFLAKDIQVRRRTRHVVFRSLKFPDDIPMVRRLIAFYAKDKGGRECAIAQDNDFIGRLIHAANGSFGVVIELIQDAVGNALRLGDPNMLTEHFAAAYAARTGCIRENNVFVVAEDWDLIDTSGLDDIEEPPPEGDSGEKPKKKTRNSKKA